MLECFNPSSNTMWFSNQVLATSKEARGEGMDGLGVSSPGVFNDSPFSDLVEEWVIFLFDAMDEFLKSFRKEGFVSWKAKREGWKGNVYEKYGSQGFKKGNEVQWICLQ